jgi:hypothetical protein
MKRYKQLVKELPSKKVIFAFGRFQPPTNGHALLVQAVTKLARAQGADHVIYASRSNDKKSNPLPVDRKVYYLKRMFPRVNFVAANEEVRTFMEAAKMLSKKYKNLVMIAGSDRVPEYKKILDKYNGDLFNFDTVEVVSAGERDPDSDTAAGMSGTKMREAAKKGDFASFKKGLPQALTELDGKRLMNELRVGMGMESIKEDIKFETTDIREAYLKGSIFNVGDKVQDADGQYEIVDRGANYISVVNESGAISKKWLNAVTPVVDIQEDVPSTTPPDEITYKGYVTKNFKRSNDASAAFTTSIQRAQDPVAILNAIKATDEYMGINDRHIAGEELTDKERTQWNDAHKTAREYLQKIGEFAHHQDYWHTHEHEFQDLNSDYPQMADQFSEGLQEMKFTDADKIKVARVIATAMGVEEVDKQSSPTNLVNMALRKIKNKTFSKASYSIISNMINTVKEAGIKFDEKLIPTQVTEAVCASIEGANDNPTLRRMKNMYHLGEEDDEPGEKEDDMSDDEIQKHIDGMDEEEFWHAYDDDELAIVDSDTGEEVGNIKEETEQLDEVLSRAERIRAKVRFARSQSKRDRRLQIALRTRSSTSKINSRARRMAVKVLKQRLARKPLDTLSVGEKERIERIVQQRKSSLNRIAMRMVPKIRRIENDRLTHKAFTK